MKRQVGQPERQHGRRRRRADRPAGDHRQREPDGGAGGEQHALTKREIPRANKSERPDGEPRRDGGDDEGERRRGHRADGVTVAVDARGPTDHLTRIPGCAPASGESRKMPGPSPDAASTMPSETPNFILRGARFATIGVSRPIRSSGRRPT